VDFLLKAQCMNDDHVCMQRVGDKHSTLQSIWVWVLRWLKSVGTIYKVIFQMVCDLSLTY
jgi:hypothetical protein